MTEKRERVILGRTFTDSPLSPGNTSADKSLRFTLASGRKVTFLTEVIAAEEVETRTYVDQLINGRDQASLTPESLEGITRTLASQQFFPVIGRLVGDKIEILDGSRRRAAALICNVSLRVMYTKSEITPEDARRLAADIQTAKEHNIREVGLRLITLRDTGMQQKEIAEKEGISPAKVTRAIHAASVPEVMLSVFPDPSELVYLDYRKLLSFDEAADKKGLALDELVEEVDNQVQALRQSGEVLQGDLKDEILKIYDSVVAGLSKKTPAKKPEVETLKTYKDSRAYARRKFHSKDRKVVYELCRISNEAQEEIEASIRAILSKYD